MLAGAGHGSGVWDYPWSVFLAALQHGIQPRL